MQLGTHPQPTAPWRPLMFRVHCVVTKRWMKIRVPFAWYWYGETEYGTPEVESGTIASSNPQPPANLVSRLAAEGRLTNAGGELPEAALQPYQTPRYREPQAAKTIEERLADMEYQIQQNRANVSQVMMGDDSRRGGR